jgi:hypothetical protein
LDSERRFEVGASIDQVFDAYLNHFRIMIELSSPSAGETLSIIDCIDGNAKRAAFERIRRDATEP